MARLFLVVVALGLIQCGLGNNIFDAEIEADGLESLARQNFHKRIINLVNQQINVYLNASYVYTAMSNHFDRDSVALPGFSHYFHEAAEFEREKAESLMKYMNKRGGKVELGKIEAPLRQEWPNSLSAMEDAQRIEEDIFETLMQLHRVADTPTKKRKADIHLASVLEDTYLHDQIEQIKKKADYITELSRAMRHTTPGLGEFIFDQKLR
ncbi:soma ferritin-like [Liolophura sinensis]|uniref:soma ferritin-like n=1 Tax=Liolophura sinensis TaxID=3198878 RepID=UPI0031586DDF